MRMSSADIIQVAIATTWLAFAVVLLRMRAQDRRPMAPWLFLGTAFCLVRAFDVGLVRTGVVDLVDVIEILDLVVLVMLAALVFATDRMRRLLDRQRAGAEHAQAEYSRALLDYTQLVRHRIANPLTAVIGGTQTLLEINVDDATRRELLESMLESARRLEQVALHPERISREEAGLEPSPAPLHEPEAREALEREGGEVESDFRDVNRRLLDALPSGHSSAISFVCECSARECAHPIVMTLADYYDVHRDPTQFVTAPGHDVPAIETVERRETGWWVVRKHGPAARDANRRARALPFTDRARRRALRDQRVDRTARQ